MFRHIPGYGPSSPAYQNWPSAGRAGSFVGLKWVRFVGHQRFVFFGLDLQNGLFGKSCRCALSFSISPSPTRLFAEMGNWTQEWSSDSRDSIGRWERLPWSGSSSRREGIYFVGSGVIDRRMSGSPLKVATLRPNEAITNQLLINICQAR